MTQVQATHKVVLLNPTGEQQDKERPFAPRLPVLSGATIAVINALMDPERSNFGDLPSKNWSSNRLVNWTC